MITRLLLLSALLFSMFACSTQPTAEADAEDLSATQEALGTCPRPTGVAGTQTSPVSEYVTGIHVGSSSYQIDVETTNISTGAKTVGTITFGVSQAKITGSGWSGPKVTQIVVGASTAWCDPSLNQVCMKFRGPGSADGILKFNALYGAPMSADWSTTNMGDGVVKVLGYGTVQPQTLKFYDWSSGTLFHREWRFEGPALDSCRDPG